MSNLFSFPVRLRSFPLCYLLAALAALILLPAARSPRGEWCSKPPPELFFSTNVLSPIPFQICPLSFSLNSLLLSHGSPRSLVGVAPILYSSNIPPPPSTQRTFQAAGATVSPRTPPQRRPEVNRCLFLSLELKNPSGLGGKKRR